MRLEEKTLLHDIRVAAERIESFTQEKDFTSYGMDEMLRSAIGCGLHPAQQVDSPAHPGVECSPE